MPWCASPRCKSCAAGGARSRHTIPYEAGCRQGDTEGRHRDCPYEAGGRPRRRGGNAQGLPSHPSGNHSTRARRHCRLSLSHHLRKPLRGPARTCGILPRCTFFVPGAAERKPRALGMFDFGRRAIPAHILHSCQNRQSPNKSTRGGIITRHEATSRHRSPAVQRPHAASTL